MRKNLVELGGGVYKENMDKLYVIEVVANPESNFKRLSHSHDRNKLMASVYNPTGTWIVGTYDIQNSKNISFYTDPDQYPRYQVTEVNFII